MKCILFLLLSFYYLKVLKIFVVCIDTGTTAKIKALEQDETLLEYADLRGIKLTKYNKTTLVLTGNFSFFRPFVNTRVTIAVYKKMANGFTPLPIIDFKNQDFCELFKNPQLREYFQDDLFEHTDLPKGCAYYPGNYTLLNYQPPVPDNMPVGEYRSDIIFTIGDKPCLKYRGHCTIVDKMTGMFYK